MNLFNFIKDNLVTIVATVAVGIATGGTSLAIQAACIGGTFLVANSIDADRKKRENESKQLDLKKGISNEVKKEVENLQEERSKRTSKTNTIDQQIAQKQAKLNNSNLSEPEKAQLKSEIATLISSKGSEEQAIKNLDNKISELIKTNPATKSGSSIINLPKAEELDFQTKLIIGGIVFLIIYFMLTKDSDRK